MNRGETNLAAAAGFIALIVFLAFLAWGSDATGVIHHFAEANPTPGCRVAEATKTTIRYTCSDGKEVIEKRKIEGR